MAARPTTEGKKEEKRPLFVLSPTPPFPSSLAATHTTGINVGFGYDENSRADDSDVEPRVVEPCPHRCHCFPALEKEIHESDSLRQQNQMLKRTLAEAVTKYRTLARQNRQLLAAGGGGAAVVGVEYAPQAQQRSAAEAEERMKIKESMRHATSLIRSLTAQCEEKDQQLRDVRFEWKERNSVVHELTSSNEQLLDTVENLAAKVEELTMENLRLKKEQAGPRPVVLPASGSTGSTDKRCAVGTAGKREPEPAQALRKPPTLGVVPVVPYSKGNTTANEEKQPRNVPVPVPSQQPAPVPPAAPTSSSTAAVAVSKGVPASSSASTANANTNAAGRLAVVSSGPGTSSRAGVGLSVSVGDEKTPTDVLASIGPLINAVKKLEDIGDDGAPIQRHAPPSHLVTNGSSTGGNGIGARSPGHSPTTGAVEAIRIQQKLHTVAANAEPTYGTQLGTAIGTGADTPRGASGISDEERRAHEQFMRSMEQKASAAHQRIQHVDAQSSGEVFVLHKMEQQARLIDQYARHYMRSFSPSASPHGQCGPQREASERSTATTDTGSTGPSSSPCEVIGCPLGQREGAEYGDNREGDKAIGTSTGTHPKNEKDSHPGSTRETDSAQRNGEEPPTSALENYGCIPHRLERIAERNRALRDRLVGMTYQAEADHAQSPPSIHPSPPLPVLSPALEPYTEGTSMTGVPTPQSFGSRETQSDASTLALSRVSAVCAALLVGGAEGSNW